ncbi:MAG: glycoside hydrolase family 15 protein [Gemmataceae bacterium]|nr:glycoside hydrolase family 15 protein [Gemmataceae bacterium]
MSTPLEDYALLGDCQSCALVSRYGSIDWLCVPNFDSAACFAALLGAPQHGRWLIAPRDGNPAGRRYRDGTLILESDFHAPGGEVQIIDCMPPRTEEPDIARIVVGKRGKTAMRLEFAPRFDYGSIVPWVRRCEGRHGTKHAATMIAGPDAVMLDSPVELHREGASIVADFEVSEGQRLAFVMSYHPSHQTAAKMPDAEQAIQRAEEWWRSWSDRCTYRGQWREEVHRSLIVLKALTFAPTGGIVAAATASLPEHLGGVRNWDYRYCWLRDATFTLYALRSNGYLEEAKAWNEWLLRAIAGDPAQMNIMYGIDGRRRLTEFELPWLPGYENSKPVRIGNAAHSQFQLDVFGEAIDAMYQAQADGIEPNPDAWRTLKVVTKYLEHAWHEPDEGIWEVRGPRQHFTHSKVMAWIAFDRMTKMAEEKRERRDAARWKAERDALRAEICAKGYDAKRKSFVQHYGAKHLDASLLMIPLVGFLPPDDPRVVGTVEAIQRELMHDGLVRRYLTEETQDGLPAGEGAFLACSFWLCDCLSLMNRRNEANELFERLLAIRNDVGLLSEEYDIEKRRLVGNFPQAFSHVGLVNSALNLSRVDNPAQRRRGM